MAENDIDLMDKYCNTDYLSTDKQYASNVKKKAIDVVESILEIPVDGRKSDLHVNQIKALAQLIEASLMKNFDIKETISIEENEEKYGVLIKVGDSVFAWLPFYNSSVYIKGQDMCFINEFAPTAIIDRYSNFEEKLCKFILLLNDMKLLLKVFYGQAGQNFVDVKIICLKKILFHFYDIKEDEKSKYGYLVIPKHNIELIEATEKLVEKEPSLREVLDFMYADDYKKALITLGNILEPHRHEYEEKIQKGNNSLFDIGKFFNFINNYKIRHGKSAKENGQIIAQKEPTTEQLKVHLDFGLSIYRLFATSTDDKTGNFTNEDNFT